MMEGHHSETVLQHLHMTTSGQPGMSRFKNIHSVRCLTWDMMA